MNLIDRIQSRLDDDGHRLQSGDFEDCATELIGRLYPGLAPIPGGTDHGLDAELVRPNGHVLGLVVTSSRSWDGAKKSLRGSLKSAREHGRKVEHVMVANLAEVNQTKRLQLAKIANEFDCDLMQVFDRAWFANEFLRSPAWRLKVLGISGGFSSFSRTARGARPEETQLSTIGRDELLATAAATDHDLVIWGVPGAGKSHVVGQMQGARFLAEEALPEQLLDDLISASPSIVVVDDAGARFADVRRLASARRGEHLDFRIAVTCWPHEKDSLVDLLPGADTLEVDLLSREELSSILAERGITRTSVLAHILEQAQGRPAWALNLADLLVDKGDWRSVWSGNALRDEVMSFLRRSNAKEEALQVLATVALVGMVDDSQMRTLAGLFGLTRIQQTGLIRSVAVAGLLDVRRRSTWVETGQTVIHEDTYQVVPRVIAASLASEVYFAGSAAAIAIHEIKEALPERTTQILQTQIHAALLGAEEPHVPTASEFTSALDNVTGGDDREELLRTYALVGAAQTEIIEEYLATKVRIAVEAGQQADALTHLTELAQNAVQAIRRAPSVPTAQLFESLAMAARRGWDCSGAIEALVTGVRHDHLGEPPSPARIEGLAQAMASQQGANLPRQNWLELAAVILTPTFDSNYQDPTAPDRWIMQSLTWPGPVLEGLYGALRQGLAERIVDADPLELLGLVRLLETYVRLAKGYPLPFGGSPRDDQQDAGEEIAMSMAAELGPRIATPGLRAVFNRAVAGMQAPLQEPDPLFRALADEPDYTEGWQEQLARREANLETALADFTVAPPEKLMAWLAGHEADFALLPNPSVTTWIFVYLGKLPNPEEWLRAALDFQLGGSAGPLVRRCVELGRITEDLAGRMLRDPQGRYAIMTEVIAGCDDPDIVGLVVDDLAEEDLTSIEWAVALHSASSPTRQLLLTHPSRAVRSGAAAGWVAGLQDEHALAVKEPNWVAAMGDLEIRSTHHSQWGQEEALRVLARLAPEAFMDLFARHVEGAEGWQVFDEWCDSVAILSARERGMLWQRLQGSPMAANLFWVLAGNDEDWIRDMVAEPNFPVPLDRLLKATQFQLRRRFPLATLAVALRPLSWTPDELLWTLEVGMGFGREHERLAGHLATCQELALSPDVDLAKLGERGVELYAPRAAKARAAARRADIRGELGP